MEYGTEGWPIASHAVDVQFVFRMDSLRSSQQVLTELVAQVNIDFVETALAIADILAYHFFTTFFPFLI